MSKPTAAEPALLAVGVLLAPDMDENELEGVLSYRFGPVLDRLPFAPFRKTEYYGKEMGGNLKRGFYSFENLVDPAQLAAIKLETNGIEALYELEGKRRANIDPGLVTLTNFVLASGKAVAHRVYLADGIYAEVEYLYRFKTFGPVEWTYADYRDGRAIEWFNTQRESLRMSRKDEKC